VEFDYPAKSGIRRTVSMEDPLVIRAAPRVVTAYEQGITIAPALRRAERERTVLGRQHVLERATARVIKRLDRS
jgi:hypothetical protein